MARSQRAWLDGPCTVSSTKRLLSSLVACMLVIALAPASALANSTATSRHSPQAIHNKQTHPAAGTLTLALGSGYASRAAAARVRALQRRLVSVGFPPGPIDGRYGPLTEQAVERFQATHGLQVDGIAGPHTLAALGNAPALLYLGVGYAAGGSDRVRALQLRLASVGFPPGPIDGRYGPLTEQAVERFQATHGLQVDGIAGPHTLAALRLGSRPTGHSARHKAARARRPPSRRKHVGTGSRSALPTLAPAKKSGSSPLLDLIVVLAALAVALGLATAWRAHRRDGRRADVDPSAGGALPSDEPPTTHANLTTTPNPSSRSAPNHDPTRPEDAERAFEHALVLEQRRDWVGAIAAYERADQLGLGPAATNLGLLLSHHGDREGAKACYRRADQRGDVTGAFNLGVLLEGEGDLAGAAAAYRRADGRGHGPAATNLGVLLDQDGDREGAEACFRRADQRGDDAGAFNLAVVLEEKGDRLGALSAYHRAGERGDTEIAEQARAATRDLNRQTDRTATPAKRGGRDGA